MLAVLGLLGVALAAAAFVQVEPEEDLLAGQVGDSAADREDGPGEVMSLDEMLGEVERNGETLTGGAGADRLAGSDADDLLMGKDGADQLDGGRGDDALTGGAGDDALWGHVGDDRLWGEAGDDLLNGGDGADWLEGGAGDDTLEGSWGDDVLMGGEGADLLQGGSGDDVLDGRDTAQDVLNGGAGADLLIAGGGDVMHGGEGSDTFRIEAGGVQRIADFSPDEDIIEVSYDGAVPVLSQEIGDGEVTLFADGEPLVRLTGAEPIDLETVRLVARV